jgi:TatA/E family protein of Tat protein translocase
VYSDLHQLDVALGASTPSMTGSGCEWRMAMIGSQDLVVGLAIALFFFGAKRLPEIARSLGTAMKEFSKGVSGNAEAGEASQGRDSRRAYDDNPRSCASCKTQLEAEWTHCPRCGSPAPLPL